MHRKSSMTETTGPGSESGEKPKTYRGMIITDLDGTLLDSSRNAGKKNIDALDALEKKEYVRVIATGRHMFSLFQAIDENFPVDYVIFSSGAGVFDFKSKKIIKAASLKPEEVKRSVLLFSRLEYDYMIHFPIPDNHYFSYRIYNQSNADFRRRIDRYRNFATVSDISVSSCEPATQILVIRNAPASVRDYDVVREELSGLTVIRTTSPLDGKSMWIEIFPGDVSKGKTSGWLASVLNINKEMVIALGNDYNDIDLLQWAGKGIVVGNSPPELKKNFEVVSSNNEAGFAEAIERYVR